MPIPMMQIGADYGDYYADLQEAIEALPPSRERSVALTKLDDCLCWCDFGTDYVAQDELDTEARKRLIEAALWGRRAELVPKSPMD